MYNHGVIVDMCFGRLHDVIVCRKAQVMRANFFATLKNLVEKYICHTISVLDGYSLADNCLSFGVDRK